MGQPELNSIEFEAPTRILLKNVGVKLNWSARIRTPTSVNGEIPKLTEVAFDLEAEREMDKGGRAGKGKWAIPSTLTVSNFVKRRDLVSSTTVAPTTVAPTTVAVSQYVISTRDHLRIVDEQTVELNLAKMVGVNSGGVGFGAGQTNYSCGLAGNVSANYRIHINGQTPSTLSKVTFRGEYGRQLAKPTPVLKN